MSKKILWTGLLLIVALVVAACGGVAPAAPAAPAAAATEAPAAEAAPTEAPAEEAAAAEGAVIKIATQTPLSGPQSVLGVAIKNGAQLSLEQSAEAFAALGFTLELAPFDDQATPDTGVANATQIVGDPAIVCMVGHLNSGVMLASMEQYNNAGLAAVSPANTNPLVTDRGYPVVNRGSR